MVTGPDKKRRRGRQTLRTDWPQCGVLLVPIGRRPRVLRLPREDARHGRRGKVEVEGKGVRLRPLTYVDVWDIERGEIGAKPLANPTVVVFVHVDALTRAERVERVVLDIFRDTISARLLSILTLLFLELRELHFA